MEVITSVGAIAPMWLIWSIIVGIAAYWYLTSTHDYWKRAGIPYIPAVPVLGSMGQAFSIPLHDLELQRYQEKGRIYGSFEGRKPVLTVGDPDVLRSILVKDFQFFTCRRMFSTEESVTNWMVQNLRGEDWKRVRAIITPAFTTGKMKRMTSIFTDSAKALFFNFKTSAEQKKPVDVKRLFGAYTMDVIASAAFGTKLDSHNDPENPFVSTARNLFSRSISWRIVLFFLFPGLVRFLRIHVLSPGCLNFFREVTIKILEERKRTGQKRNDFLQLLLDSTKEDQEKEVDTFSVEKDETHEMGHEETNDQVFKSYRRSKYMSVEELIAQCVIFFLAGYDTTASALSFTAFELALNPDIQDKLITEIDEVIERKGGLTYEAVCEMKYLDKVVSESLRKHPPSIRAERISDEDYEVKGHNIKIPKGMIVGFPIYAMHHDPEYYPDPEKFDPDRFATEQKSTRHPYSYLPFGAGPRNCLGMRFAVLETKICLAYILRRCRFSTCPQTQVPPDFYIGQGLMQPKRIMLQVELRNDTKEL